MKTAIFKFNNSQLALLCSECRAILKTGKEFTIDELKASQGKKYLPPQYCDECKVKKEII